MTLTPDRVRRLPFGRRPTVHVCMRDDAYGPEDRLYAVQVHNKLGELVISLQADDLEEGVAARLDAHANEGSQWLHVDGTDRGGCFALDGYRFYTGNILWDAGTCEFGTAIRLVCLLLHLGFHVDEVVVDP